ncbi:hypothetical protein ACIHCQ_24855 [Streptomyces sp. NPDC052236]|uniref:hypothetical protein n=1 Tax=Streptomyces sp. NPDC052236 TaxID=3365686 RepID=UPI0037D6BD8D
MTFDGTTITVPGIQIVGRLSSVVPYCAPTDGPRSVAAERSALATPAEQRRRNYYALPHLEHAGNGFVGVAAVHGDAAQSEEVLSSRFIDAED